MGKFIAEMIVKIEVKLFVLSQRQFPSKKAIMSGSLLFVIGRTNINYYI